MSSKFDAKTIHQDILIFWFLTCWTFINVLQAATLEIHADEAYYWLYSRFLDWGYYDHPPMVAVFISTGYRLIANELGVRLITILSSTASLFLLWKIARNYAVNAGSFILITCSLLIFHIYGFITTPDAPLFFFTVLFYYLFKKYLEADSWQIAILIAITLAGLLYSKYHGVLLIVFTVAANVRLLKRPSFWCIVFISALLYVPHIWWQVQHNFPSVEYHLFERTSEITGFANILLFPLGQILVAGPLVGWLVFYYAFKIKTRDAFIRTLIVNAVATLIFFWISAIKGEVQPHWTLIAFVPIALLALISFSQGITFPKWAKLLAYANILCIVLFRIALIIKLPVLIEKTRLGSFFGYKEWAHQIHEKARNAYVIFSDGFQDPAKYCFYNNSDKGFSYDSRYYRRTQFDLWPIEQNFQGKRTFVIISEKDTAKQKFSLPTSRGNLLYTWVDSTRTYQQVYIKADRYETTAKPNEQIAFNLHFNNPYSSSINFNNAGRLHPVVLGACFIQGEKLSYAQKADSSFYTMQISPGKTLDYVFNFKAPPQKGTYNLIFSLRTTPFTGGRNSRAIKFTVQ